MLTRRQDAVSSLPLDPFGLTGSVVASVVSLVIVVVLTTGCSTSDGPTLADSTSTTAAQVAGDPAPIEVESGSDLDGSGPPAAPPALGLFRSAPTDEGDVTTTTAPPSDRPPLVIYDTDMGPDVDDVLALAILHTYADRGLVDIAAVTVSRNSEPGARFTDGVNTFYRRPDIPVGIHKGSTITEFDDNILFTATADSWPHDLKQFPDGYRVIRQVLVQAEAQGREVIVIQTGFSGNLADLLRSGPDDIDGRDGVTLVADTVDLLSIMAGSTEFGIVEFNIERDIASARHVFANWPTTMVVSPFELGYNIVYPYSSITRDFGWVDRHPVRVAYEHRDLDWHEDAPPFYNMRSWDLTSVMYAVEPDSGLFTLSEPGRFTVAEDGSTTFTPGAGDGGRVDHILDRGTQYTATEKQAVVDRMIELVSARPSR